MIPAVILAGGAGRRIGGDKALQPLGRGTLLSAVQGRLAGQVGRLALNAAGDPARFAGYSLPVLPDPVAGHPGPLAGVLAALSWAEGQGADRVLVVPCDVPFLPGDLVARLSAQPGLVVARDDRGDLHPTLALWPVAMAGAVRAALSAGERRLRSVTAGAAEVTFPAFTLRNINKTVDLASAQPFDRLLIVDWSGGADRGPRPTRDAIWAAWHDGEPVYLRSRALAEGWLSAELQAALASGQRVLVGCDFAFGYPAGFAARITGRDDPLALWDWLADNWPADALATARFVLAGRLNGAFGGGGPFWGNGLRRDVPGLHRRKPAWQPGWPAERRTVERACPGTFTQWQLAGAGAVGSQTLTGLPALARLRARFGADLSVWPFQPPTARIVLAEVWPSLIRDAVRATGDPIPDRAQVHLLSRALAQLPAGCLPALLDRAPDPEGWILGVGHETLLRDSAARIVAQGAVP